MLSKSYRLSAKEIPLVIKSGKRQNLKYFSISFLTSARPLIAVIVANKIDNRSTVRNKIKRRLKEAIQKNLSKFQNKKVVFLAKNQISAASFSEIEDEVKKVAL